MSPRVVCCGHRFWLEGRGASALAGGLPATSGDNAIDAEEETMARTARDVRCSFCGKAQDQVKRLIVGPNGVAICDECVSLCNEIIAEEAPPSSPGGRGGTRPQGTRPDQQA